MEKIKLNNGAEVYMDRELDKGRCKGCRKLIYWASTISNGKKIPIIQNEKGEWVLHFFYHCSKAKNYFNREYEPLTNGVDTDLRRIPKSI